MTCEYFIMGKVVRPIEMGGGGRLEPGRETGGQPVCLSAPTANIYPELTLRTSGWDRNRRLRSKLFTERVNASFTLCAIFVLQRETSEASQSRGAARERKDEKDERKSIPPASLIDRWSFGQFHQETPLTRDDMTHIGGRTHCGD